MRVWDTVSPPSTTSTAARPRVRRRSQVHDRDPNRRPSLRRSARCSRGTGSGRRRTSSGTGTRRRSRAPVRARRRRPAAPRAVRDRSSRARATAPRRPRALPRGTRTATPRAHRSSSADRRRGAGAARRVSPRRTRARGPRGGRDPRASAPTRHRARPRDAARARPCSTPVRVRSPGTAPGGGRRGQVSRPRFHHTMTSSTAGSEQTTVLLRSAPTKKSSERTYAAKCRRSGDPASGSRSGGAKRR